MQNERKELTIVLVGYILLLLVDGIIRNYMISKILPESYQSISNVINGFSLFFSTIFMFIVVLLSMTFTFLYIALFKDDFGYSFLIRAWVNLLAVDIIFGIAKFSLLWILLDDELSDLVLNDSVSLALSRLPYTIVCSHIDIITVYISIVVFSISLYLSNKRNRLHSIILSSLLLSMMLLLYYKFI
ncbi:hypothetical protein [Flavobacterium taihuense]|uniref:Yip1 domain-containing protein n=1 Tax=Flavobacterium taihuense TaxID=2857508 RepID=A0ABS6XWB4_9FLAO|nr:hypothetical protein [Flavobacterium taihuense]MBW4360199.1 hypothetical protein [Flavobacterium taihuense]